MELSSIKKEANVTQAIKVARAVDLKLVFTV